jgi:predicted ABC-type ATPase
MPATGIIRIMTEQETRLEQEALVFARSEKKSIARRLTDTSIYLPEEKPVSVFMAGSPGAGKTEASIELLRELGTPVIRIDADELRDECPGYTGDNAWLFQKAVSVLVEKIIDMALDQDQSFLLDGTLSRYELARRNIDRSLKRKRPVQILYVYQEPQLAWEFVQAREKTEGRRVRAQTFIDQYFGAREVINQLKRELGKAISVDLLIKNNDNSSRQYKAGVDQIDYHIPEKYSRSDVEQMLKSFL